MGLRWQDIDLDASTVAIRQTECSSAMSGGLHQDQRARLVALDP